MSKKVTLILATATKVEASDSLVVFIEPEYADFAHDIFMELRRITGHENHTVLPVPANAVKIFRVRHPRVMTVDAKFAQPLTGEKDV